MKNVVSIVNDEIRLCSGLDEYKFGKTHFNSEVTQSGILATCDSEDDQPLHFSFENWSFADVRSFEVPDQDERIVFFCNKNPLSSKAKSLLELYEKSGSPDADKSDKDKMYFASLAVCTILTQAAKEDLMLPVNGSGGILVDGLDSANKDKKKLQLLFLPQELFKNSIAGLTAVEQADLHNCWINPSLKGLPADRKSVV